MLVWSKDGRGLPLNELQTETRTPWTHKVEKKYKFDVLL